MWLTMQFGEIGFVLFLFKSKPYVDAFFTVGEVRTLIKHRII